MQRSHLVLFDCRLAAVAQPRVCSWPALGLRFLTAVRLLRLQQGLSGTKRQQQQHVVSAPALGARGAGKWFSTTSSLARDAAAPRLRGRRDVRHVDARRRDAGAARAAGPRPAAVPDAVEGEARLPPRRGRAQRADGALRRRRECGRRARAARADLRRVLPPGAVPQREGALRTQGRLRGRLPRRRRQALGPADALRGPGPHEPAERRALCAPAAGEGRRRRPRAEPAAARAPAGQGDERAGPVREDEESGGGGVADVRRAAREERCRNHSRHLCSMALCQHR